MGLCSSKIPDGDEESTTASTPTNAPEEVSSKESEKTTAYCSESGAKVDEKPLGRERAFNFWFERQISHLYKQNMMHTHITLQQGYSVSKQEFQDRTDCSDKGVFARRVERGRGDERGGRWKNLEHKNVVNLTLRAFEIPSVFGDGNYERR